ncbi:MAG: hypothetical protein JSU70_18510 [Phycisphaerales bacterium]|nr:MAG: hypothetical protein JSU70_18510 [Phycisphaerales bacterium]
MIRKAIFLVLFTPIHGFTTAVMLQRFLYNQSRTPSVIETLCKIVGFLLALPVLYPCILIDPDGEWFPRWLQIASVFVNGFIWGLLVLLVFYVAKRLRRRKRIAGG